MKVLKEEIPILIDVDNTLIEHIDFKSSNSNASYYGTLCRIVPKKYPVELLKAYHRRGYFVEVASANGWQWAKEVVEVLGLAEYVDVVRTKPMKYMDDKPADSWMHRIKSEEL